MVSTMAMAGFEAHEFLAQKGFSPKIFDNDQNETEEEIYGCKVIVMEYLQGYNTWPDDPTQEQREKLKRKAIHGHENLRAPNILVKDDDVKLVDFDWAGKENEVRYHCIFNEDIK